MRRTKQRFRFTTMATALTAVAAFGLALPGAANGQPGTTGGATTSTVEVVAEGLNGARKVTWDPFLLSLLVAEAGSVPAPCAVPAGCFSQTGAIFAYTPWLDHSWHLATGLPSLVNPGGLSGLNEVNRLDNGELRAVFGLTGRAATRDAHGPDAVPLGQVNRISWTGRPIPMGDLVAHEESNNPDGGGFNSNPFGMVSDSSGSVVVDAGANAALHVARNGTVTMLTVPPRIEFAGRMIEPVPSAVVRGPDGAYYIGELTGGPFPMGMARVWKVVPGQAATLVSSGFTNIIDLAFDRRGRLLVLEFAERGLASGDPTGRLVRIEHDGTHTVLARDGLVHPGGVAVTPIGDIYVTNRITGPDGAGQLLRIRVSG